MPIKLPGAFLVLSLIGISVTAQIIPPDRDPLPPDAKIGSYYSVLPLAGYTSDLGLFGGGFIQRINYDINRKPFLSTLKADITFSTTGNIVSQMQYERTRLFGSDFRSRIDFIGQREREGHYFGIGNNTEFSDSFFREEGNFYENREFFLKYRIRQGISSFGENGQIDFFGDAIFWHVNGISNGDETLISEQMPPGLGKSRVTQAGFGFIADSRNNEFAPSNGIRYELGFNTSQSILGSNYSFSGLKGDFRHFQTLFGNVTLAHNLRMEHTFGTAPFWALPIIGNEAGLRGYYRNRFRGSSSILNIVEIRSWLFTVFSDRIRVGAQTFWDTGRVYSEFDSNAFFDDWKHTFGAGGVVTLFNPDLILRGDIGFSDETWRIYFGAGYIF